MTIFEPNFLPDFHCSQEKIEKLFQMQVSVKPVTITVNQDTLFFGTT